MEVCSRRLVGLQIRIFQLVHMIGNEIPTAIYTVFSGSDNTIGIVLVMCDARVSGKITVGGMHYPGLCVYVDRLVYMIPTKCQRLTFGRICPTKLEAGNPRWRPLNCESLQFNWRGTEQSIPISCKHIFVFYKLRIRTWNFGIFHLGFFLCDRITLPLFLFYNWTPKT